MNLTEWRSVLVEIETMTHGEFRAAQVVTPSRSITEYERFCQNKLHWILEATIDQQARIHRTCSTKAAFRHMGVTDLGMRPDPKLPAPEWCASESHTAVTHD